MVAGAATSQHSVAARANRHGAIMLGVPIGALVGAAHVAEGLVGGDVCISGCESGRMIVGLLLRWEELIGPGADDGSIGGCVVKVKAEVETEIGVELEVVSEVERIGVERVVIPIRASHLVFGGDGNGLVMVVVVEKLAEKVEEKNLFQQVSARSKIACADTNSSRDGHTWCCYA